MQTGISRVTTDSNQRLVSAWAPPLALGVIDDIVVQLGDRLRPGGP